MRLRQGDLFGATKELSPDPLFLYKVTETAEDDDEYIVPQLYAFRTTAPRKAEQ